MKKFLFALLIFSHCCKAQNKPELILPLVNSEPPGAVFSQNNKYILTFSDKLILWDAASARVVTSVEVGSEYVIFADFIEDGKSIIATTGNSIKVWDLKSGKLKYSLKGHTNSIYSAIITKDKKKLITLARDNTLRIWSLQPGRLLTTIKLATDEFTKGSCLINNENSIAISSFIRNEDKTVLDIWQINSGKKIKSLFINGYVMMMHFTQKIGLIISSNDEVHVVNTSNWSKKIIQEGMLKSLAADISPDQSAIATMDDFSNNSFQKSASADISILDTKDFKEINYLEHRESVPAFCLLNDSVLISSTIDGELYYWNIRNGEILELSTINAKGYDQKFVLSSDKSRVCLINSTNRQLLLYIWDTRQRQLLANYNTGIRQVTDIAVSGSGDSIFFNNEESLKLWNSVRVENIPVDNLLDLQKKELKSFLFKGPSKRTSRSDELGEVLVDWKRKRVFTLHDLIRDTLKVWDFRTGQRLSYQYEKKIDKKDLGGIVEVFTKRVVPYSQYLPYEYARICDDASLLFTSFRDETFNLWKLDNNTILFSDSIPGVTISGAKFNPDNSLLFLVGDNDSLYEYTINEQRVTNKYKIPEDDYWVLNTSCTSTLDEAGNLYDLKSGSKLFKLPGLAGEQTMRFSSDDNLIAYSTDDYKINIWNTTQNKVVSSFSGHQGKIIGLTFAKKNDWLVTSSADNTVKVWDIKQEKLLATFILFNEADFIIYLPSGYYMATKGAVGYLSFRSNGKLFPVQQFDAQFNRPDKVLEAIGNKDTSLINLYKTAYQKRIQKAGIKEANLTEQLLHLPKLELKNETTIPPITQKKELLVSFNASDNLYKLHKYYCWINDIPVNGSNGITIQERNTNNFQATISILLNQGFNKIQLSCINSQGVESLRETFYTNFQPIAKQSIPKTYYIGIGVSDYKDTKMNLRYAYKDVVDLDAVFKSTNDSANYRFHVFGNAAATRENILQIKKVLAQSNIEDKVIISISGHGLLDGNNEFYFATHDMDFNNPASKGLSYDSLEDLLDDIPARKKLLLIDACHSGEVDKEVITEIDSSTNVKTYGAKGFIVNPNKKSADLQNSFELMRELFADLSRGNGSIVISAAGGLEYALEDEKYSNGVFTYSIKKGLLEGEADKNANQKITVNELKEFVTKMVMELTKGRQRPTSRKEALEFDWTL